MPIKGFIDILQTSGVTIYKRVEEIVDFSSDGTRTLIKMESGDYVYTSEGVDDFNERLKDTAVSMSINESVSVEHGDFTIDGEVALKLPIIVELLNQLDELGVTITWPNPLNVNIDNQLSSINIGTMPTLNTNQAQTTLTMSHAVISVTTSSTSVLAAANRKYLRLTNGGLLPILIRFGTSAASNNTLKLYAGQTYDLPPNLTYTGAITAIMASGTGTLYAVEGT